MMIGRLLACLALTAAAMGCGSQQQYQAGQLQPPKNVTDLVLNMKRAVQSEVILHAEFYAKDNLKQVFGGTEVAYLETPYWLGARARAENFNVTISGFPDWLAPMAKGANVDEAFLLSVREYLWTEDKPIASILFQIGRPAASPLDFDAIVRLFTSSWVNPPPGPLPLHGVFPPSPTRPHGNERIIYSLGEGPPKKYIAFAFNFDATLAYAQGAVECVSPSPRLLGETAGQPAYPSSSPCSTAFLRSR
jgi:hypothetical protein